MAINNVVLVGRLTRDPDTNMTSNNVMYTRFTLAVDRPTKDDKADFISCIAWRQNAKFLDDYASKGMMIAIEGHIETGNYEKDSVKHYTTDVVCDHVMIAESKKPKPDAPYNGTSVYTKDVASDKETDAILGNAEDDLPW